MTGTPGQTQHTHSPRHRSKLRRWIAPIACLLIGMVLSIVSGWVCDVYRFNANSEDPDFDAHWLVEVPNGWPRVPYRRIEEHGVGWTSIQQEGESFIVSGDQVFPMLQYVQAGWPFRSVSSTTLRSSRLTMTSFNATTHSANGLPMPMYLQHKLSHYATPLPIIPLFPGFALNTLIYAALTWCIVFAPGQLRRRRRLARHQCPACAYPTPPIGTTTTCTECGEPVFPHTPRATKS